MLVSLWGAMWTASAGLRDAWRAWEWMWHLPTTPRAWVPGSWIAVACLKRDKDLSLSGHNNVWTSRWWWSPWCCSIRSFVLPLQWWQGMAMSWLRKLDPRVVASSLQSILLQCRPLRDPPAVRLMSSGKGFNGPRRQVRFTEEAAPDNDDGEEFLDAIDEGDEDDGAADLDQPDDEQDQEQDGDDDQAADLSELAQVLTLTAKKLSSLTLGRKFSGRPPSSKGKGKSSSSSSMADRKKVTHCTACGALGHWHEDPECPLNQGGSQKPRQKGPQQTSSQPSSTNLQNPQSWHPTPWAWGYWSDKPHQLPPMGNMFHHQHDQACSATTPWDQWSED